MRLRLENASRACWRASSLHERGSSAMRHAGGNLTTFASDVDVMLVDWRGEKLDALSGATSELGRRSAELVDNARRLREMTEKRSPPKGGHK